MSTQTADTTDDSIVHGIIRAGDLAQYVDILRALVDEAKVHCGDHGFRVSCIDPADAAGYHDLTLPPRAFEAFESPGQVTLGWNLERLAEILDPAADDDIVDLHVDMEEHMLRVEYGTVTQRMAMIDPESIRQEPDSIDLDLSNTVTVTRDTLDLAVTVCSSVVREKAPVTIEGLPEERAVRISAEGDTDDGDVTVSDDDTLDPTNVTEDCESMISLSYLDAIVGPIPKNTDVTIRFDDEFPVTFEYACLDGDLEVKAMIAPRIISS